MPHSNGICIVCGGHKFELIADRLRDSDQHKVVRCTRCGPVQISPLPSLEGDKVFYDMNRQSKNIGEIIEIAHLRSKKQYDTRRRANFVANRFPISNSVLDVGSGYGFFLEAMSYLGYNVSGIEPSFERRMIAERI